MPLATPNFEIPPGVSEQALRAELPLELYQCEDCGHVQVGLIGNPDLQYREYVYETSRSLGLAEHFLEYAANIVEVLALVPESLVVEIGSNDGTLLTAFAGAGMRVQGVDPARRIAQRATARGIPTIGEYFDEGVAGAIRRTSGAAGVVSPITLSLMWPSFQSFMCGVERLLADDGVFVFETQYGGDVVERVLLDTVYHEHVSYFFTRPTKRWLARFGLEPLLT